MTSFNAISHAKARFECLAEDAVARGDTVAWAMCSVDAEIMERAIESLAAEAILPADGKNKAANGKIAAISTVKQFPLGSEDAS